MMDLPNILNNKGNAAAAAEARFQQQISHSTPMSGTSSNSDIASEPGSSTGQLHPADRYSSPVPTNTLQMMPTQFPAASLQRFSNIPDEKPAREPDKKSFACSHCSKGFARRSDLARHERIHSGERPHVCEWPDCGKQFIQRSALTVHTRVHTGDKPHMCERCGKPFSDSSSLARHRRIHSGKRPYKCPYANCQKTFTRRTTLTRHQNHHTGTIEEAAAETNAKLSTTKSMAQMRPDGTFDAASQQSSPSPLHRPVSMSPHELPPIPALHRRPSEMGYLQHNGNFPPHLRHDFAQQSPRSSPGIPSPALSGSFPQTRPSMTSHPAGYGPPQPLEPPTNPEPRGTGSATASPHLQPVGWGSPSNQGLPSPHPMDAYSYPDPTYGGSALYYPGSNIRRPQSTEPDQYETKPRHVQNQLPSNHMQHMPAASDWSNIPMGMQQLHHIN